MEKTILKGKKGSLLVFVLLITSIVINGTFVVSPLIKNANAADITTDSDSNSSISIWVWTHEPRIEWHDFQWWNGSDWESVLNEQIDVNETYRFVINITSDQGWADIDFINFTAWFDNGSEATVYNDSLNQGGNLNLKIMYENTTATGDNATFTMLWPDDEVTFVQGTETFIDNNTRNITVEFIPGLQFRYAPDPTNAAEGYNDLWSWNFNISSDDADGYHSYDNPVTGEDVNEFGVYSFTQIISTTGPNLNGAPGEYANGTNVTIQTIANANFSLSVNVSTLLHQTASGANMSNTTVRVRGGDLENKTHFNGTDPIYLYGSNVTYRLFSINDTSLTTSDIEYECAIPGAQLPGNYRATIYYVINTQTG